MLGVQILKMSSYIYCFSFTFTLTFTTYRNLSAFIFILRLIDKPSAPPQRTKPDSRRLKVPEGRGDFPDHGSQAVAPGPQFRVQRNIIHSRSQDSFHQSPVLRKPCLVGMRWRCPVPKQSFTRGGVGPQDPPVLQAGQILITGIFTQRIHDRRFAHEACKRSRGSPRLNFGTSRSSTDGTRTSKRS